MDTSAIVNSAEFTSEQKEYLQGFFAGVAQRGLAPFVGHTADGRITSDPNQAAESLWFNTPVEDLAREERWKHEQDPFSLWDKLLQYANRNEPPTDDDRFRIKYFGLFYVAPAQDSFMLRLRIPGGILFTHQLRGLAQMAEEWGSGRADLTTRSNLQIREFQPKDIVRVLNRLQSLGMTSRGAGADNIRNITASPTTGLDPQELLDVAPLADAMQAYISNSPDMYLLPRKFNIAFDNGGAISVVADTNDIGFIAVEVRGDQSVPAGVYFRVLLCGITGHRQFATDCGLLLRPDQTVAVAAAMVRVFTQHGDRTDRKEARLKYLVDQWGVEKFLSETEKLLAFPLIHVPASECEPRRPIDRAGHIGVHAQAQPGLYYIGVSVPVGQLPVSQMKALADIADRYGSGELRLTVWQNLLIPNISGEYLEAAREALVAAGLNYTASTVLSGTIACTGSQGCRFAASDTKTHAVALARQLDKNFPLLDQPINLHVTGCSHSCAQHYVGDVGLMGVKVGGEEGYQVLLGGGTDQQQGIARELIPAIKFSDLPPVMDRLFQAYIGKRNSDESFLDFTRRHDLEALKAFCVHEEN
ncbi:NirA family protein [Granulicella mallensis]|uniref:Precorrin-3B synthase n=1 Tax=Granulicella mallensis (strain ATCC BAA-1857 / DSM 23137 / MP5ACTX8) TaxID=682795 RepID=G8NTK9_GRAMM|nr:NirA family protein [Granulicella mallensis]AEU35241.1 precorrin-3B synthase [Granulicella mallensis MP5ACTX8]